MLDRPVYSYPVSHVCRFLVDQPNRRVKAARKVVLRASNVAYHGGHLSDMDFQTLVHALEILHEKGEDPSCLNGA